MVINDVLNVFCMSSGEKVNKSKTQVFFSRNVNPIEAKEIGAALGFSVTKNLGKYLGMPVIHSRVNKQTYQEILDKVNKRLSGWNAMHLSLAGRLTLTQSVIQTIPIYAMQTTKIPSGIRDNIDQACRHFIWSGTAGKKKMSLVKWDHICQPKLCGGLGLKNLSLMNGALLMKIGWGLISSTNSLWYGSYMWKAVGGIWPEVLKGIKWDIGNGNKVRFWWDNWATEETLCMLSLCSRYLLSRSMSV
ncbi:putative ribonuclease H protein [Citrus sinensis]|nr:putative ribonuclease H protein [Citrus sinensis]